VDIPIEVLLKNADSAMYLAKTSGKSGYRVFGGNGGTWSRQNEDEKGQQA